MTFVKRIARSSITALQVIPMSGAMHVVQGLVASSSSMQLMSRGFARVSTRHWLLVSAIGLYAHEHRHWTELGEWVTIPTTYAGGAKCALQRIDVQTSIVTFSSFR
jgi:hypothetical protein